MMKRPSFEAALGSIDAALAGPTSRSIVSTAFKAAYRNASDPGDWLSVLKRARTSEAAGDRGRYVEAASFALKKNPKSEPVSAVAAHAYLRSGQPEKAFALFSPRGSGGRDGAAAALSPDRRPGLWAESFVRAARPADATIREYARLASIVGDGTPYLGAAVSAMAEGDLAAGRYWLRKAIDERVRAPADLAWDCGLYEELSRRTDEGSGSEELAVLGDAARKAGDIEIAKARWERSIALEPRRSWKPYASLALASGAGTDSSRSYWERLRAAFLSGPKGASRDGALRAYASELAREGRDAEALRLLDGTMASDAEAGALAVLRIAILGKSEPEGRVAAGYARLAETRPDDPVVLGSRLRLLAEHGLADELVQAYDAATRRGFKPAHGWFYGAWALAARGRTAEAADLIVKAGSDEAGPAAAYSLGSLRSAQGQVKEAAELFEKAASSSSDGRTRAVALKAKGRALGASGDSYGAAAAFKAATIADPDDAEAAVLARGASLR